MKKAVILHGTDSAPDDFWMPWVKSQLEDHQCEVYAPVLPKNHTPDKRLYEDFLKASNWDFEDNIIVGHSSGATTLLNLLSAEWFPKIKCAVLVGTFLNEKMLEGVPWYEKGQFDNLFLDDYDSSVIKEKAKAFIFVHGSDDPYCDIKDAKALCDSLNGKFIVIENGHHLAGTSKVKELPELMKSLVPIL